MGRRKIEIQPILHDRNRSVTFLKRKNGLFKKAYELGVLCSVDVLVVVFGHNQKLYEYCSSSNGNPNRILEKRVHFNGEREGRSPNDFNGDKSGGANDDNDNDDDIELDEGSDEAQVASHSRRPPPSSSVKSQAPKQSAYATRGRSSSGRGHDEADGRMDSGGNDRPPPVQPDPSASGVPYHIAQLLAAAATGGFDPSRQQAAMYSDPNSHANANAVAAASSLGASLAQLLGANPYMASQLTLPNLLSLGALGLNPGGGGGGAGLPGFGGGFPTPNAAPNGLHPLYSTPLFASLLQQTQQQQQQQIQSTQVQNHNANSQNYASLLFPSLPQQESPERRDASGDSQRPQSSSDPGSRGAGGALKVDWPAPHSYRQGTSSDASSSVIPSQNRGGSRSPEPHQEESASGSLGGSVGQGSTFLDFLNAISTAGGTPQSQVPGNQPAQSQSSGIGGFSPYSLPNISNSASNPTVQSQFGNLGLLSSLGLGMGLPSMNQGLPPGGFGSGGSGGGGGASSSGAHDSGQRSNMPARKRPRSGSSYDEINPERDFPLSAAMDRLPPPPGLERYMNQDTDDGGGSSSRHRGGLEIDEDMHGDVKGSADALHMDLRGPGYEEDIRVSKRGRPS